jgi:hypothetical protein
MGDDVTVSKTGVIDDAKSGTDVVSTAVTVGTGNDVIVNSIAG